MSKNASSRVGEKAANWKGDKVNYFGIHAWIRKVKGDASFCSFDKTHVSTKYEWANISGTYSRDPDDYMSLCHKCHVNYDRKIRKGKVYV